MDIQTHLRYWKTCNPRAQGGYGLAELAPDDTTTVQAVIDNIQQATGGKEKIGLIVLNPEDGIVQDRQLVCKILGEVPKRGVGLQYYSNRVGVYRPLIYSMIFIDHAEYLSIGAMAWICSHMREAADVFVLVARDISLLYNTVYKSRRDPEWVLGRSFPIDLKKEILECSPVA